MPWGRLDDGLYDHPKLDLLGRSKLQAVGLWTLAISWSNRRLTDGFIPTDRVLALNGTEAIAERLVVAGMFERADGGYLIHDFLTFNESREQVEIRRESDRKRKRTPTGFQPDSGGKPTGLQTDSDRLPEHPPARAGSRPVPSRPIEPPTPASGGRPSRANGTNPRAQAKVDSDQREADASGKRWRAQQRQLAAYRDEISESQRIAMDGCDAPLTEIPGWHDHQAKVTADAGPAWLASEPPA